MRHLSLLFQCPSLSSQHLRQFLSPAWEEKYPPKFGGVTVTGIINSAVLLKYLYTPYVTFVRF